MALRAEEHVRWQLGLKGEFLIETETVAGGWKPGGQRGTVTREKQWQPRPQLGTEARPLFEKENNLDVSLLRFGRKDKLKLRRKNMIVKSFI